MELRIRDVSKTYPNGVRALKDVTLTIPAGMYGLLGPNGAGKSTPMRILVTLQKPDGGSVRLGDTDVLHQKDALGIPSSAMYSTAMVNRIRAR
jgi:ABC-type multidrug transport system ATPase subunit